MNNNCNNKTFNGNDNSKINHNCCQRVCFGPTGPTHTLLSESKW